jgi:hypothetical protein
MRLLGIGGLHSYILKIQAVTCTNREVGVAKKEKGGCWLILFAVGCLVANLVCRSAA